MSDSVTDETKNAGLNEDDTKHVDTGDEQTNTTIGEESKKKNANEPKINDEGVKTPREGQKSSNGDTGKKGVTRIPVTGEEPKNHGDESKKPSPSSDQKSREDFSIPVTIHHAEQKKPSQHTKKQKAEMLKQQANKEFGAKHYAAAIQLYNEALNLDPTNHLLYSNRAAARYNLAQEISKQAEHPDAINHCAIHSEASLSWNASTSLYYGGLEDALKAIEIEPNFLKAYLRVGACLVALGKYQAAVQTYEATLTRFPTEESVKTALKEAREKAAKLEEGFPLYHSFINLVGQPHAPEPPVAQEASSSNTSANEVAAARLHQKLFGKRNALVPTSKPETRWQFYFDTPPNPRSTASWEQRRQQEEDEGSYYYQGDEEDESQQYRSPHAHFHRHTQYQQPSAPRFQRPPQQPPFQQPYHQQSPFQQTPSQTHFQQQPHYQQHRQQPYSQHTHHHPPPSVSQSQYQPNKKRSDHTSIPDRKATNGYLQELCENLRVSQYLPALFEQGVETVDDLMLLPPEAIQSIFPTLGHQARVLDWLRKAKGEL